MDLRTSCAQVFNFETRLTWVNATFEFRGQFSLKDIFYFFFLNVVIILTQHPRYDNFKLGM